MGKDKIKVENVKVENVKVDNVSRETSEKSYIVSLAEKVDSNYKPLERVVAGQSESYIEFQYEKKEKGKDAITVTRTSTDIALITTITTIEKLCEIQDVSDIVICIAMGRVTKKDAESIGLKKPTDLLKSKFSNRWSDNTIVQNYNVAKVFSNASGDYTWRTGVPSDMSVSNLAQLLRLCDGYKDCVKDNEFEAVFNTFYNTYIRTNRISFAWSQKRIKEEIDLIKNPKGKIIDGQSKDVTDKKNDNGENSAENANNSSNTENSAENANTSNNNATTPEDVESKWKTALNSLTIIQTCFKGSEDSEVLKAIEKLSEKITEMLDKSVD